MTKRVYLVDTENEGGKRFIEIVNGDMKDEEMYLLYTKNTSSLKFANLEGMFRNNAKIKLEQCNCGNNALDFQLCGILGYLIAQAPEPEYVILSNDHGYDPCIAYWTSKGVKVSRMVYFANQVTEATAAEPKKTVVQNTTAKAQKTAGETSKKKTSAFQQQLMVLLKAKGLQDYDVAKMEQAFKGKANKWPGALAKAIGNEKAERFFEKTTKVERKKLNPEAFA